MDIAKAAEKFAKEKLDEENFLHSIRVRNWAVKIGRKEGADIKIIEIASLLHDIEKSTCQFGIHHLESAKTAESFLKENNVEAQIKARIVSCIKTHMAPRKLIPKMVKDFKERNFPRPTKIEEKCVYDADLLELIGPVGLLKILDFCLTGWKFPLSRSIEFAEWLMRGSAEGLYTETSKEIAKPFISYQNEYFRLYKKQLIS